MSRSSSMHPTELELEILKILWEESPLPVREVRARLESQAGRKSAHSTVITMLNIMFDKGFLKRKKDGKSFLFSPKVKNCLLYTSPSPRDATLSRMPSSA